MSNKEYSITVAGLEEQKKILVNVLKSMELMK